jgi:4-hydroxythreonine-4-phosphate dehydrogenase
VSDPPTPEKRRIGITLGDPSGVGPEIIAATLAGDDALRRRAIVYCDLPILERAFAQTAASRVPADLEVVDRGSLSCDQAPPGRPTAAGAAAQVAYLEAAANAALAGEVAAVVTAPISKAQARAAGFSFPGQTEFFARRLRAAETAMMFVGPRLRVVLATVHLPLAEVPRQLTADRIVTVVRLATRALERDLGVPGPRVGVLGLNPHAGEAGLLGPEEETIIVPALEECRRALGGRAEIAGPLSPDTAFRADFDLFVAMYHDQGLIPVKLVDFEESVNLTLGLPIVRTSPDHGVAYDAAGTGRARPESFRAALALADSLVTRRAAT